MLYDDWSRFCYLHSLIITFTTLPMTVSMAFLLLTNHFISTVLAINSITISMIYNIILICINDLQILGWCVINRNIDLKIIFTARNI